MDLDTLIEPLLFATGSVAVSSPGPTGHHVCTGHDHLVAVLYLLLDDAARHARARLLAVTVERRGERVDLTRRWTRARAFR